MKFPVTIIAPVKNASPELSSWQIAKIANFYKNHEGKFVQITIREQGKPRSISQNAYYHGVIVDMLAEEWGYDHDDMHEILREKFLKTQLVEFKGEMIEIRKSTTKLSTGEFEEYAERIRIWAARDHSITIPLPHESI